MNACILLRCQVDQRQVADAGEQRKAPVRSPAHRPLAHRVENVSPSLAQTGVPQVDMLCQPRPLVSQKRLDIRFGKVSEKPGEEALHLELAERGPRQVCLLLRSLPIRLLSV
eukprot:scaffold368_cov258-Pinguiococcus_pyrenoidosus.AAC.76